MAPDVNVLLYAFREESARHAEYFEWLQCTYITTDRDFARFPRLRWQHPLDQAQPTHNPK